METPPSGTNRATGPVAFESLEAIRRPSSAFSSFVVRISVIDGLWTYRLRSSKRSGTVSRAPKLTMSSAPTDTTCGSPSRPAISSRSGPAESTPPTRSSQSSVVVASRTPRRKPDSMRPSIACPPTPVAWKMTGS